jgi:hypothetical protein
LGAVMALAVAALLWWPQAPSPPAAQAPAAPPASTLAAAPVEAAPAPLAAEPGEVVARVPDPAAPAPRRPQGDKRSARSTPQNTSAEPRPAAPPATGVLQLAVSPWGEVEVDGAAAGTTPPLARLTLPVGTHTVVIRNQDFPPYRTTVTVGEDRAATVRHRFGS